MGQICSIVSLDNAFVGFRYGPVGDYNPMKSIHAKVRSGRLLGVVFPLVFCEGIEQSHRLSSKLLLKLVSNLEIDCVHPPIKNITLCN